MKNWASIVTVVLTAIFAAGCMTQRLSDENRAKIRIVSVDQNIVIPDVATYAGNRETILASLFLPFAYQFTRGSNAVRLKQLIVDNHIDLRAIFYDQFTAQLKTSQLFASAESTNSEARFTFEIIQYGLEKKAGFSGYMQPNLIVKGWLKMANGEVIWKHAVAVDQRSSETESYKGREFFSSPLLVRKVLEQAVKIAVKEMINEMHKG